MARGSRPCWRRSRRRPVFPPSDQRRSRATARSRRSGGSRARCGSRGPRVPTADSSRAEDFFGFQRRLAGEREELEQRLTQLDEEYRYRSAYAKGLAAGPARASLADMEHRYGKDPDARSHGQAFLNLFQGRLVPGGLYLLDEPEAPLSPQNQLGLLAILLDLIEQDAQFIIATHSPILLALPGARIYSFDGLPVHPIAYAETDHVALTRAFLNDPQAFLRRLGTRG